MASVIDVSRTCVSSLTCVDGVVGEPTEQLVTADFDLNQTLRQVVSLTAKADPNPKGSVLVLLPSHQKTADGKLQLLGAFRADTREIDSSLFDEAFGSRWEIASRGFALAAGVRSDSESIQPLDEVSEGQNLDGALGIIDIGYDHLTTAVRKRDFTRSIETQTGYREWSPVLSHTALYGGAIERIQQEAILLTYDVLLCKKWSGLRHKHISKDDQILFNFLQGTILGTLLREFLLEHPGVGKFLILGKAGDQCISNLSVRDHPAVNLTREIFAGGPMYGRETRASLPIFTAQPAESPYLRGGLAVAMLP